MELPQLDLTTSALGGYALPNIGATAFVQPNYGNLPNYVVVDIPSSVFSYLTRCRLDEHQLIEPFSKWPKEYREPELFRALAGPVEPIQMACGGFYGERFHFTNGRHRSAALLDLGASHIPFEMDITSATALAEEFELDRPARPSPKFLAEHETDAYLYSRGFPPGLGRREERSLIDDYRTVSVYQFLEQHMLQNRDALQKHVPNPEQQYLREELKRGITDHKGHLSFLERWKEHLGETILRASEDQPSILPYDWDTLPVALPRGRPVLSTTPALK